MVTVSYKLYILHAIFSVLFSENINMENLYLLSHIYIESLSMFLSLIPFSSFFLPFLFSIFIENINMETLYLFSHIYIESLSMPILSSHFLLSSSFSVFLPFFFRYIAGCLCKIRQLKTTTGHVFPCIIGFFLYLFTAFPYLMQSIYKPYTELVCL